MPKVLLAGEPQTSRGISCGFLNSDDPGTLRWSQADLERLIVPYAEVVVRFVFLQYTICDAYLVI
jgi:hypothetical protein